LPGIEDAVTLIRLLDHPEDVDGALARYDALRRHRTQPLAKRARRLGMVGQARSLPGVALRNAILRSTPSRVVLAASESIQRWSPPMPG
jgi:2-polyprenyl-6-methoxyphenol hydroxylase-like FAD-dependent oxidoreductase